jgi:hypothetical protein
MGENEIRPRFAKFRRGAERGQGLSGPFRPFPEPHRIDMGIADEMDFSGWGHETTSGLHSRTLK